MLQAQRSLGFSFCGRHSSEFGCWYTPGPDRWANQPPYETFTESVLGRHGGYYFGNRVQPRPFEMPCYCEDIDDGVWERILHWLGRDQLGPLTFDDRPGMVYTVRVAEVIQGKGYVSQLNGVKRLAGSFTIQMMADEPFARIDKLSVASAEELLADDGYLYKHTGLLPEAIMPPLDHSGAIPQNKMILLYNPGSERCPLNISVAGTVGDAGLSLYNRTTEQRCSIINLTAAETTDVNTSLEIDAEYGRVSLVRDGAAQLAFPYHDEGYIQQVGAHPIDRDLVFTYEAGERKVSCAGLRQDMMGKYVYLHGQWVRLENMLSAGTASVNITFQHGGTETTNVVRMNELVITSAGISLSHFVFSYVPRYQ